tara:strand:- start:220 stop:804 length:585 start_codon:yes stop_codon:yes gene_type:complete
MFVLIDNYDSFTFNLWHYLGELGIEVAVHRNDTVTPEEILALNPQGIVISPGPCDPDKAGICLDLITKASGKVPILGVCLGHQCIGQVFGAKVVLAPSPMHGKVSQITHDGSGVFAGLPSPFTATRYHSLTLDPATIPDCLRVTAHSEDGVIQGVAHRDLPVYGVQFHPESIASEHGHDLLRNFVSMTGEKAAA